MGRVRSGPRAALPSLFLVYMGNNCLNVFLKSLPRSNTLTNLQTHRNKKPVAVFNLGELFCGPGGGALGAINANFNHDGEIWGFEHAWASDIDEDTCETFRHNICPHQPASVICQDVHELDIANLPNINAFSFGFPCNDFSLVGETNGLNGEYGPLTLME